jgi:glutathione S-transferase
MTLKLFYAPGSCALVSHIVLEEAGADYEAVRLNFRDNEQRGPEYLAINPKGRAPALVTDRGVITETPAILAYVAQTWPQAGLAPVDDPFAFAQVQAFNDYLASTVHVAYAHGRRGYRWADDPAAIAEMARKAPLVVADCFQLIESQMLRGPYVMGDTYGVCDPYLFLMAGWLLRDRIDTAPFPRVMEHYRRVGERPAVRKVLAEEAA